MECFFWSVVKKKAYERNPYTVNGLKEYILEVFIETNADRDLWSAEFSGEVRMMSQC